jgi:hypothetical protein
MSKLILVLFTLILIIFIWPIKWRNELIPISVFNCTFGVILVPIIHFFAFENSGRGGAVWHRGRRAAGQGRGKFVRFVLNCHRVVLAWLRRVGHSFLVLKVVLVVISPLGRATHALSIGVHIVLLYRGQGWSRLVLECDASEATSLGALR